MMALWRICATFDWILCHRICNAHGARFIGMHITDVKLMRLYHQEGHSWVLDTATARVCLMSQRADGSLVRATAPHAACYFCLLKGNPRNYPITSCPCTHPCQWLILKLAGLLSIQILSDCCSGCGACYESQKASKIKEKRRGNLLKTVQKLLKFYAQTAYQ